MEQQTKVAYFRECFRMGKLKSKSVFFEILRYTDYYEEDQIFIHSVSTKFRLINIVNKKELSHILSKGKPTIKAVFGQNEFSLLSRDIYRSKLHITVQNSQQL